MVNKFYPFSLLHPYESRLHNPENGASSKNSSFGRHQEELECQIEWDVSVHQPLKMVPLSLIKDHLARHGHQSDFYPVAQVDF